MKKLLFLLFLPIGLPVWALVKLVHFIGSRLDRNSLTYADRLPDGFAFERFVAAQLRRNGFRQVSLTPPGADYGVDVTAEWKGKRYGVQCKFYTSPVGNQAVQEITAGLSYYRCDFGIVVTNNRFTANAIRLARANGIFLWDRELLEKLLACRLPRNPITGRIPSAGDQ